ncbi:hypothetical protein HOLleu_29358 [Holothuria leucospilota]|uniref:Uncharacterized protein n=1 Tax=Holothuria leucospilota TaxID=206669 RepID=A0A9Q1H1M5_HOLLE|nr:hypothetical protein HOLleu_29358 [Holothuria leucospilota]
MYAALTVNTTPRSATEDLIRDALRIERDFCNTYLITYANVQPSLRVLCRQHFVNGYDLSVGVLTPLCKGLKHNHSYAFVDAGSCHFLVG